MAFRVILNMPLFLKHFQSLGPHTLAYANCLHRDISIDEEFHIYWTHLPWPSLDTVGRDEPSSQGPGSVRVQLCLRQIQEQGREWGREGNNLERKTSPRDLHVWSEGIVLGRRHKADPYSWLYHTRLCSQETCKGSFLLISTGSGS